MGSKWAQQLGRKAWNQSVHERMLHHPFADNHCESKNKQTIIIIIIIIIINHQSSSSSSSSSPTTISNHHQQQPSAIIIIIIIFITIIIITNTITIIIMITIIISGNHHPDAVILSCLSQPSATTPVHFLARDTRHETRCHDAAKGLYSASSVTATLRHESVHSGRTCV